MTSFRDKIAANAAKHLEQRAAIEEAKAGKTFRRSGKHVRAANRLRKRAEKIQAKQQSQSNDA
jgi:hypothetical protein